MPELPEVETVIRTLETQIMGSKIIDITVWWDKIIARPSIREFKDALIGQTFIKFDRRGKYLILHTNQYILIIHLRMEGKFYLESINSERSKHTHVIFKLDDNKELHYNDTRKFGRMYLYRKDEELTALSKIGHDPWDEELTAVYLKNAFSKRKTTLKQALLDQSIIAGIGNIYADEICFMAKLAPTKIVNTLSLNQCEMILVCTKTILKAAIKAGGTTIRSYTSSLGISGRFQLTLKVHTRANESCYECQNAIKKIKINGRGTYFCPNCQKE